VFFNIFRFVSRSRCRDIVFVFCLLPSIRVQAEDRVGRYSSDASPHPHVAAMAKRTCRIFCTNNRYILVSTCVLTYSMVLYEVQISMRCRSPRGVIMCRSRCLALLLHLACTYGYLYLYSINHKSSSSHTMHADNSPLHPRTAYSHCLVFKPSRCTYFSIFLHIYLSR